MSTFLSKVYSLLRTPRPGSPSLDAELLEDRIMLSAVPMVDTAIPMDGDVANAFPLSPLDQPVTSVVLFVDQVSSGSSVSQPTTIDERLTPQTRTLELVFINSNTPNYQQLVDDLLNSADSHRDFEVYVLDASKDGIQQISEILAGYSDVDAIHLVSHSEAGSIQLGQSWLGNANLTGYAGQLASWQSSLSSTADILVYGCDLADSIAGRDLVESISALTGADVAASVDDTGHSRWGGNWDLEYHVGAVESGIAFSTNVQQNWLGKLATITVTTFTDVINSSDGVLSLREAIIQANSGAGGDTIVLSAGTYTLTLAGTGEDAALTGDLDINKNVTITGATAATTIINGNGIDRVFHIAASNVTLSMSELTIQGGNTTLDGGGIYLQHTNDQLNLSRVVITGNNARNGAGVFNEGILNLTDVVISNNGNNTTVAGGGIYNRRDATLNRVSIYGNQANNGGGIYENGQSLSLTNVTISGNTARSGGGGISNQANVTIFNSTIANNTAVTGGGIHNPGNTITITNTVVAGNTATGSGPNIMGAISSLGHNLVQSVSGASGFVASDITGVSPLLASLADNGGFGKTHQLALGSQAIDAGTAVGAPTVDGRNISRNALIDIGAFELLQPSFAVTGTNQVNATTAGIQTTSGAARGSQQSVASDNSGDYVVTWSSHIQDGSGWGVYARRFDSSGVAITGEILVNSTTTNDQQWSRVASDANGNFVVTWTSSNQDGTPLSVYVRSFSTTGTALTSEFRVHTTNTGDQSNSSIAMDSLGNFIVAWQGEGTGDTDGIFARRFAANGTAIDATEFIVNTDTSRPHLNPTVTMNDSGAFAIAWDNSGGVRARLFDSARTPITGEVTLDSSSVARHASIAMHSDGSFVAVWRNTLPIVGDDIFLRRYNSAGTAIGGIPLVVNSSIMNDQSDPSISMDSTGNFIVIWEGNGSQSGQSDTSGVFGQKYNASGTKVGGEFLFNTLTTGIQNQASVAILDLNNFVAVWSGEGPSETNAVFARQFASANIAPTITSNGGLATAAINVAENTTTIATVTATDTGLPAQTLTYSISGGVDSAKFAINSSTGALRFIAAPNFEVPTDIGANNVYDIIVRVSDGALTDTQAIAVTVTNVNEAPVGVADNYTLQEDGSLTTVANWFNNAWSTRKSISFNNATGPNLIDQVVLVTLNASNIDYSLTQNSGQDLRFVDTDGTLLNYEIETWNEAGTSTVWVRVPQINAASTTDSIWMYYGNATAASGQNANGVWTSSAQAILHMNGTVVDSSIQANTVVNSGTASATGIISGARSFNGLSSEINLGSAAAVDNIFDGGGTLAAWINPTGWGENNFGRIADKASTIFNGAAVGTGWALQLNGANQGLIFEQGFSTTTGRWQTAANSISLNTWQQITVIYDSTSAANNPRVFINGVEVAVTESSSPVGTAGSDAAANLKIGNYSQSTDRTFAGAIDEFQLYNATLTANQIFANYQSMRGFLASIGSAQSGPGGVLTNDRDVEGASLSVTLGTGPTHQQSFTLNANGSFTYTPVANYNGNDSFTYSVSDGVSSSGPITVSLTITAVNDIPMITSGGAASGAAISLAENTTVVTTVTASDPDLPSQSLTYSLTGGTDQGRFAIGASSGALTFLVGPNFEAPSDSDVNNTYQVIVTVSDGQGGLDTKTILVSILDANEFATSAVSDTNSASNSVNENSTTGTLVGITALATDGDATNSVITYSLTNNAGGRFAINSTSGVVSVADGTLLDFEVNGSHQILVQATSSDGSSNTTRFTIVVNDVNESLPVFVSSDQPSIAENQTVVQPLMATDADLPAQTLTYSIVGGADIARFTISVANELVFVSAPDFENPGDANADNIYQISVVVSDGNGGANIQAIQVHVTNANEQPQVVNQNFVVIQGESYQSSGRGVLAGASDVDGDTLNVTLFASPSHGTLVLNPNGSFNYTPDSGFSGIDTFTFQASDGNGGTSQGAVSFLVSPSIPIIPTQQDLTPKPSQERTTTEDRSDSSKGSQASSEAKKADSTPSESTTTPQATIFTTGSNDSSQGTAASRESDRESFSTTAITREEGGRASNQVVRVASLTSSGDSTSVHRILRGLQLQTNIKVSSQDLTDPASLGTTEYTVIQSLMWDDLDRMREQIRNESSAQPLVLGTYAGVASSLSVGYVMWLLRGGYVVAGFMAQLPAWRLIDPLPVLAQLEALGDDDDDDSLQTMVDRSNTHHENNPNQQNDSKLAEVDSESNAIEVIGSRTT